MQGTVVRRWSGPIWTCALVALATLTVGAIAAGPASAASTGKVHYGKRLVPRTVHAPQQFVLGAPEAPGLREVEGQPPPGLGGGIALSGLPPVIGEKLIGRGNRGAFTMPFGAGAAAQTGSFAALETLTGASFGTTCTTGTDGICRGSEPPDTQMAVGRNEVVEAVNSNLFVFSRGGTQLATYPLTTIFQPPGQTTGVTDPKIVFDPTTNRYYMTEMVCQNAGCGANNYAHMGISLAVSADPAAGWTVYDYLNDGQNLQDQEKLGFSGDKITFAVNEYGCKCGAGSSYKQENIVVVQKSDAIAGNTVTPAIYNDTTGGTYSFDSMPTTPVNASTGDNTQYVVWNSQSATNNKMKLIRITGTPRAGNVDFTGSTTDINIANQTAPPAPVAQGGNLAGDKQNLQSAMVQGNDLWAVASDGCTPQYPSPDVSTRSCTRLVEVDLGNNSVVTDIDIGTNGTYRVNPSVSKDGVGNVFFGFTISSASTYATAAIDASALPLPAVLQRYDMATGDSGYGGGRWGDYSGTQQDPVDNDDVWTAQEFGNCTTACNPAFTGGSGPLWGTALGQFTFRNPRITSINPNRGPVTGGTSVDIYGEEFANGATTVKFGDTASPNVTWITSTHIRALSPPGSLGTVHVTATTAAGSSDTSPSDEFTYQKIPTHTRYTGPTEGDYNDPVTLSGTLTNDLTSGGVSGKTIQFTLGAESCSAITAADGSASCSVTPLDVPGAYTVQASFGGDGVYDSSNDSKAFTVTKEESALAYDGPLTSDYHDTFTASATMTDPDGGAPIAGKPVTFRLGTTDSCATTTDGSGKATCSIRPTQTGTQSLSVSFDGDTYYLSSSDTKSFSITPEETTATYTGPTVILAGASNSTLTATLVEDGANDNDGDAGSAAPDPAETVTLSVGSQQCTGTTDGAGNVSCTIPSVSVPLGPQVVGVSFAGDAYYRPSSDMKNAIVFAFPSRGVFTIGDTTAAAAGPLTTVNWWNQNWSSLNALSGGAGPQAFKGFVATVALPSRTPANICSGDWTSSGGNSASPPATVPSYMGTIVANKVTKSGSAINGHYLKVVVVKTDPGYSPSPASAGSGRIIASFCP